MKWEPYTAGWCAVPDMGERFSYPELNHVAVVRVGYESLRYNWKDPITEPNDVARWVESLLFAGKYSGAVVVRFWESRDRDDWCFLVMHPALPGLPENRIFPILTPIFHRDADGKVRHVELVLSSKT